MFECFKNTFKREIKLLCSRKLYLFGVLLIPLTVLFFLPSLMESGIPQHIPTALVDMDNTVETREIIRLLDSSPEVDIVEKKNSYAEALELMKQGKVYGIFVIPHSFTRDVAAGRDIQISYYTNSTFYIPGSLLFKGLKTTAKLTSAAAIKTYLIEVGASKQQVQSLLQPVNFQAVELNNPWTNYSVYLSTSFVPCALALLIFLCTCYSICSEEKRGTSREWLASSGDSIVMALTAKLLPQTIVFTAVGVFSQVYMFGFLHYPMNGSLFNIVLAMILFVLANQAMGVFISGVMPNLRFSLSICSLIGMLSFSIGAFSFPMEYMYGSIGIFSYIIPSRYYFLIYADQALNGLPMYYSRFYYMALLVFLLLPLFVLKRLYKAHKNPVYVP